MVDYSSQTGRRPRMRLFAWLAALAFVLGGAITGYFAYNIAWQQAEEAVSAERATARLAGAGTAPPGGATPEPAASPAGTMAETASPALDDPAGDTVERVAQQQGGIDSRLAAAEQRLARLDLQSEAAAGNAARAEGLLIAFAARRALERGADLGYLADQLQLRFGDALPNAVAKVIAVSRDPVTVDRLVARLDGLAPQLARVQTRPSLDQLWSELGSLFVIRRETTPSPLPVARVERARLFLQSGRIEAAIAEVERLPGAGAADDWIEDARRYAQAQQALDLIETSAVLEPRRLRDGEGRRIDQPSPAAAPGEG